MTKDEIIKALRDMAKYPTVTLPRDCEALRMAADLLAQPEHGWTPERIAGMARLKDAQDKRLAQPEQEPVACVEYIPCCTDQTCPKCKAATPPQRKPLTDEEIILIVAECASSHQHTDIHFARAIERAHGIKELV